MPETSGDRSPETQRQNIQRYTDGRFIFITGDIDGEDTRQFLERTRCSYFMKPFNLERLMTSVDMLVGGRTDEVH